MSQKTYKDHLYALVLAGGGGTRLWPKSRNATPKQFLTLFKDRTFTQGTLNRINKLLNWDRIFVVTSSPEYKDEIIREVPDIFPKNVIVEPMRRDTAPAHALGAMYIRKRDPKAIIINEAADHVESPQDYIEIIKVAAQAAYMGDYLVAIGVKPSEPHTGLGYIQSGKRIKVIDHKAVFKLSKFTEKPKLYLAKRFLALGRYYWNANHYVWTAEAYLKALKEYSPQIYKGVSEISKVIGTRDEKGVLHREYEKMPKISVDYAISEKAKNFLLVTTDHRWVDIGDWDDVWENSPKDKDGNVVIDGLEPGGEVMNIGTTRSIIQTDGRLIAVVGVDDVAIIDTKDALLVCSKSKAQDVKKIVNELKKLKRTELL